MDSSITNHPDFKKYSEFARKLSQSCHKNIIWSQEDVYQELLLKIVQTWDYVHSFPDDPKGPDPLMRTILKNRVVDIVTYCSKRPDTSVFSKETAFENDEEDSSDILDKVEDDGMLISQGSSFDSPEESLTGVELLSLLTEMRDTTEDNRLKEFLDTIISREGEERIDALNREHENNSLQDNRGAFITPFLRSALLKFSSSFPYRVMKKVKKFLDKKNFRLPEEYTIYTSNARKECFSLPRSERSEWKRNNPSAVIG